MMFLNTAFLLSLRGGILPSEKYQLLLVHWYNKHTLDRNVVIPQVLSGQLRRLYVIHFHSPFLMVRSLPTLIAANAHATTPYRGTAVSPVASR